MSAYRPRPAPSRATIKPRRPGRFSGRRSSVGRDRRLRIAHSWLEGDVIECLMHRPDVVDVIEQPPAITYVGDDGKKHRHTFDAIVVMRDGTRIAIVIKPRALAEKRQTRRLVDLLALHLPAHVADAVLLVTEEDVDPDVLHDARLVGKALLHPNVEHDGRLGDYLATHPGPATVAELCAATGLGGHGFRAVARLVGRGQLKKVSPGRITPDTLMARVDDAQGDAA